MLLTPDDLAQLAARGVTREEAEWQIQTLRHPPPAIVLDRPCTVGDGIRRLTAKEQHLFFGIGRMTVVSGRVTKFVPASGAATRMFKDLIAALHSERPPSESAAARELFARLDEFPFAAELREGSGVRGVPANAEEERRILHTLLVDMRYARLPKALIPFHHASPHRTAFEEQLLEGIRYTCGNDGRGRMHFTVAPEFRDEFALALERYDRVRPFRHDCALEVTFSEQDPATDTLAIDENGQPFRLADGSLLFRPGGHGSLLSNLNALAADIAVIKNVDNILPDERTSDVVHWKLILIGVLAALQSEQWDGDRPIRVCGVVKNEGEPGGAPFWVTDPDGRQSIQIVESSQVDATHPQQQAIFQSSTHFNPVDIVCGLRDREGRQFDLQRYVDPRAVFIASKTHQGRALHALERPGLWNGAMAFWQTVCVEVPGSTFAPVKTVFDLLRPQHQPR